MRLLAALGLVCLLACSGGKTKSEAERPAAEGERKADPSWNTLPREVAVARSKHLSGVIYKVWLKLDEEAKEFEGRAKIEFDTKKPRSKTRPLSQLPIDFTGGKVNQLSVNGAVIAASRHDGLRITIEQSEIKDGHNVIEVSYTHGFGPTGLIRSKDPADGSVYLYSRFAPFEANRVFPCFDQPDLRGSLELTVEAPTSWQVISNTREKEKTPVDGRKSWAFPRTNPMSSYLYTLAAGPWQSWSSGGGVPLRLFARKSAAQNVDTQELFKVTSKGIEHFADQFGVPFPYSKYDQVLVPDLDAGAIEGAGAVFLSENAYAFRGRAAKHRHTQRSRIVLQRLAQNWFGGLVGLRWWNGLWLNEGFIAYFAADALDEAVGDRDAWLDFYSSKKQLTSYYEDQLVTTHPVEGPAPDTEGARVELDGITFGKSAAVMKQFRALIGDDDFHEGIRRYFHNYAGRSPSVADFFRVFAEASGKDLKTWQHEWLRTPGLNTLKTSVVCEENLISKLTLIQGNAEYSPEHRTHQTELAFYGGSGDGKLKPITVPYVNAETEVPEAAGMPCPTFIFPNHGDQDYVKVLLEGPDLEYALKNLHRFTDALTRQMVWGALWEAVVDGKLKAKDFADASLEQLKREHEPRLVWWALTRLLDSKILRAGGDPGLNRLNVLRLLVPPLRDVYAAKLDELARERLMAAGAGTDLQLVWYQGLMDAAVQPATVQYVASLLLGKAKLKWFKLDADRRWEAILALSRVGFPEAPGMIQLELEKDPTERGKRLAIRAQAMAPNAETKKIWLSRITSFPDYEHALLDTAEIPDHPPVSKLKEAGRYFHQLGQESLSREAVEPYFELLPKLSKVRNDEFTRLMIGPMFPPLCDPQIDERAIQFISKHPELPAAAVKMLRSNIQEDQLCVRGRQKSG